MKRLQRPLSKSSHKESTANMSHACKAMAWPMQAETLTTAKSLITTPLYPRDNNHRTISAVIIQNCTISSFATSSPPGTHHRRGRSPSEPPAKKAINSSKKLRLLTNPDGERLFQRRIMYRRDGVSCPQIQRNRPLKNTSSPRNSPNPRTDSKRRACCN